MDYTRMIDRTHPGCVLFLIDQSRSMEADLRDRPGVSKAQGVADAVNELLAALVRRCLKDPGEPPRPYYDIGIIGYGRQVRTMLPGQMAGRMLASVPEIADGPLRVDETDGIFTPVWFDPVADGATPMCRALDETGRILESWVDNHRDSFPPIVVNVTDGESTDGDPTPLIKRLRGLRTDDGGLLFFTIVMSSSRGAVPVTFPDSEADLPDRATKTMFRLSSELPDLMREQAAVMGRPAGVHARGFCCNAGMTDIAGFLSVGTYTVVSGG